MASDAADILAALQLGDSAFPAGAFAFSWGLEGLAADGFAENVADIAEIVEEQLVHRWNSFDRLLLRDAYAAASLDEIAALDRLAEAATPSEEMRIGAKRAGRALLGIFARLGHARAIEYRAAADGDDSLGHLAVAQGVAYRDARLSRGLAELLSGWTAATGLASAALRLGLVGHLDAQHTLTRAREILDQLLARDVPPHARVSSFTPLLDIAVSRNSGRHMRLFAT